MKNQKHKNEGSQIFVYKCRIMSFKGGLLALAYSEYFEKKFKNGPNFNFSHLLSLIFEYLQRREFFFSHYNEIFFKNNFQN